MADAPSPDPFWPAWITVADQPDADAMNASLLGILERHVAEEGGREGPTWASGDDLLQRHGQHSAMQALFRSLSDVVFRTAHQANQHVWAELGAPRVQVAVVGAWFQVQNDGGRHGVHNHGNCSWSGVYTVDVDPADVRTAHPLGTENGVLRFHGPHLARSGGAHVDLGSAYLQRSAHDVAPKAGRAVVFPSWLLHEALPYQGERDRVVIAFNAQLNPSSGSAGLPFGFG